MLPRDDRHLPTPATHPPGFWQRHAVEFPEPLTPFLGAWVLPFHNAALRAALSDLGALVERVELREIEGFVYRRVVPFGLQRMPPALFRPIYRAVVRVQPVSRRRLNQALQTRQTGAFREPLERWNDGLRDELLSRQDALLLAAAPADDDAALDAFAEQALRFGQDAIRARCRVLASAAVSLGMGRDEGSIDAATHAALHDARRHLTAHDPIAGEPISAKALAAESTEAGRDTGASAIVRSIVVSSELALRSPVLYALTAAIGSRLAAGEHIDSPDDVYFLTLDEARGALRSGESLMARVTDRRDAWQRARSSRPPDTFGQPPPHQPLTIYPRVAAEMTAALLRSLDALWGSG